MKVTTNISIKDWVSFVKSHPNGSVFQMPEMFELFESTSKFKPLVIGAHNDSGELCGILLGVFIHEKGGIGKLLSSRFVVYGGPLLSGESEQQGKALNLLLEVLIIHTKKKALFIQFRNFFDWSEYLPVFEKHGFHWIDRLNYIIRIKDPVSSIQHPGSINMSPSRRRQIKKALASGAEIIEPQNIEQVKEFYNILYNLYRYKVKKPLPDWSFFKAFYELTLKHWNTETIKAPSPQPPAPSPIGFIRLIRYKGQVIGGILSPILSGHCVYEWYVCGLDKEFKDQYPSVLATWAGIEYAIQNGFQCFDFMGVGKPDVAYGVREFKARFGGELVNYGRFTRINNKFLYNIAELGYNVLALLKKI